jgi:glucose/arabinose dehydrogenase
MSGSRPLSGKKLILLILIIILIAVGYFFYQQFLAPQTPQGEIGVTIKDIEKPSEIASIEIVAENLNIPWEIAFLPRGEMLVTERPGNLLKIGADKTIIKIQGVEHVGEGGLQGMALHPNFANNNWLYLYLTTKSGEDLVNRVERYKLTNNTLSEKTIIIDNIPGAKFHDGGRIEFGPDKKLYITTGDATQKEKAQDLDYLGGKILRINDDGSIPEDNPFENSPIYSYGHRNPQGLAWDEQGQLWITEHGRSVPLSGYDELNIIEPGKNYGWPEIQGPERKEDMVQPMLDSGPNFTWAPAGAAYYDGSIFFAGLRGEALYEYNALTQEFKTHFFGDFGRLRAVVLHNGFIYVSTSNMDGRGEEKEGDDKIIKINLEIFR